MFIPKIVGDEVCKEYVDAKQLKTSERPRRELGDP